MIPAPLDPRKPFVLQYTKVPPLRWRRVTDRLDGGDWAWGLTLCGGTDETAVVLYLGKWLVGIERTREGD